MASQIELIDHGLFRERPDRVRGAYFRAALTELCRVEDSARALGKPLSFYKSDDPSLHIVKLLRNYQVHVSATHLSAGTTKVMCAGEAADYQSFIADNVTAAQLKMLDRSSAYSDKQLSELVVLFNQEQRRLGVVQLLYSLAGRVEEYARKVLISQNAKPARKPLWPS